MSADALERFRVRSDGQDVRVDANTVDISDRVLRFHDDGRIKAQFLRWDHYVCEGPANSGSSGMATGGSSRGTV